MRTRSRTRSCSPARKQTVELATPLVNETRKRNKLWTLRVTEVALELMRRYLDLLAKFYYDDRGYSPIRRFFNPASQDYISVLPPLRVLLFLLVGFFLSGVLIYAFGDTYVNGKVNGVVLNATEFPINIAFRNVGCKIPDIKAPILEGITGEIAPGRLTGILGRSGSGKTTLARALLGRSGKFCSPSLGSVYTNGHRRALDAHLDRVGFVPQDDVLYPEMTVEESLMFSGNWRLPLGTSNEMKEKVLNETLQTLGLQHVRHKTIGKGEQGLSGGERKRVSIGLELISRPSILVMDEPTTGLDSAAAWRLMNILRRIADSGVSVVVVVHQPSTRIYNLFHDIILLERGRSVYAGSRNKVLRYFNKLGYNVSSTKNPSEFILDILVGLEQPVPGSIAFKNMDNSRVDLGNLWKGYGSVNEMWRDIEVRMELHRERETSILRKIHGEEVLDTLSNNQEAFCDESYPSVFKVWCLVYLGFQDSYYRLVPKPGLLTQTYLWFIRFIKLAWRRGFLYDMFSVSAMAATIGFNRSYSKTWNRKPVSNFFMSVAIGMIGMLGSVHSDEVGPMRRAAAAGMLLTAHELAYVLMCIVKSFIISRVFCTTYQAVLFLRTGVFVSSPFDARKNFEFYHIVFLTHLCAQGIGAFICVLANHDMVAAYIGSILMLIFVHFFALYTPSKTQIDENSMIFGIINTAPLINGLCSISYARYFMEAILLWEPEGGDPVGRNFVIRYFNYREEEKTMCCTCLFAIWSAVVLMRLLLFIGNNGNTTSTIFLLPLLFGFLLKVLVANTIALLTMTAIHEYPKLAAAWQKTVEDFKAHQKKRERDSRVEDEDVDILN